MAGPAVIGALRVVLGADTVDFEDGIGKLDKSLSGINKTFRAVDKTVTRFAVVAASAAAGLLGFVKHAAKAGDEIDDTSKRLGISAEQFQELAYAASIAGVSQEEMTAALEQFNKRLGEFKEGGGEAANALLQLGLRFEDVRSKSPHEAFRLVADRLAGIQDPMRRAAIEADLFGKAGVKLDNIMTLGAAGLQRFADEARAMGLVLSNDTIRRAGEIDDEFTKMGTALKVAGIQIAAEFLPVVQELRKVITSPEFVGGVRGLASSFRELIGFLVEHKDALVGVAGAFAGMKLGATVGRMFGGLGVAIGGATGALIGWHAAVKAAETEAEQLQQRYNELSKELTELEAHSGEAANSIGDVASGISQWSGDRVTAVRKELNEVATKLQQIQMLLPSLGDAPPGAPGSPKAIENMRLHNQELEKFLATQRQTAVSLAEEALPPLVRYQNELINLQAALAGTANAQEVFAFHAEKAAERYGLSWKKQVPDLLGAFSEVASGFGKENAKMAKTAKILGAAQALIATLVGAAEAYKLGPIAGIAASALILAKGLALVAAIKAEPVPGFATGGSFRVGGSGGIDSQMVQFRATPGEMVDVRRPDSGGGERGGTLVVEGLQYRSVFDNDTVRVLAERLLDFQRDGGKVVFAT